MAVQTHPPLKMRRSRLQSTAELRRGALGAAHGALMDYFDPSGAHIAVRYEGTAPQDALDYRVERDGIRQGLITRYPDGSWQAANADGRTFTGFTTPLAATAVLLDEVGLR